MKPGNLKRTRLADKFPISNKNAADRFHLKAPEPGRF